jgi:hypothetical protein
MTTRRAEKMRLNSLAPYELPEILSAGREEHNTKLSQLTSDIFSERSGFKTDSFLVFYAANMRLAHAIRHYRLYIIVSTNRNNP